MNAYIKNLFLLNVLFGMTQGLFGAASSVMTIAEDKRPFLLAVANWAIVNMRVIARRTDPLREVVPLQSFDIPSEFIRYDIPVDCLAIAMTFPKVKKMIFFDVPNELKSCSDSHQHESSYARLFIELSDCNMAVRVTSQFIHGDTVENVSEQEIKTQKLLSDDEVRQLLIDRCSESLQSYENKSILIGRKYLRASM